MTTASHPSTAADRRRAGGGFAADLGTAPNIITLSRLALILIAAGLFFADHPGAGIALGVVAGVTDYLDGWLARRTGQVTRLGEILDQFSDIFFESMVLYIAIAQFHFLPLWVLPAYLARELWVTTIRRFMAGHQLNISTNFLGKLKTNFVMWGFVPTFLSIEGVLPALEPGLAILGRAGIGLGILFGYLSGADYTRQLVRGYDQITAARAAGTADAGDGWT
ncbi:MAG: CDP-alcohol phosphatidyltransferase family protein [Bacteroidota bacterium]